MDISEFSKEVFDSKKLINEIFKTVGAENKKKCAEDFFAKTNLFIQEVNSSLNESTEQILTNLPDIMDHINVLKDNVSEIRFEISSMKEELAHIQNNSSESILLLEYTDNIKTILKNAKKALHEADNWIVLTSELEEVFVGGDIDKITQKLVSMQQSLNAFSNSDDYEDRRIQLEGYKNRLEAIVSPKIAHAFVSSNTDEASKIYTVFVSIERVPQLLRYYVSCQKGYIFQRWKSLIDLDQDHIELVRMFYSLLLDTWQNQVKWCNHVFPTIQMTDRLRQLYADVLFSMDPSLQYFIDLALKQHNQPLLLLLQFYELTVNFHRDLDALYYGTSDIECSSECDVLMKSIYNPYVSYASKYGILERQILEEELWTHCLNIQSEDLMDSIQSISQTVPIVINIINQAKTRCSKFTNGCSFPGLITTLRGCLLKYVQKYRTIANSLTERMSKKEDWNLFHLCLSFQQTVGTLLNEIKNYDLTLVHSISSNKRQQVADRYKKCLLTDEAETQYEELLASVLNGSKVSVLDNITNELDKLFSEIHKTAYEIIFYPITNYLENVKSSLTNLSKEVQHDLPDYSYSPLEYITQIGEYLITLPQHLEPFLMQENTLLVRALNETEPEYYCSSSAADHDGTGGYVNTFLSTIARGVCNAYCEQILSIRELSTVASKQLAIDIDYLGNVLEELGVGLTETLKSVIFLLRLPTEDYQSKCTTCPPKLVAAIRQIRNIPPTS